MKSMQFHREETGLFSRLQLDLVYNQEQFGGFISEPFSKEAIGNQIKRKATSFSMKQRVTLQEALFKQYHAVSISPSTKENIESLISEDAFTITTGHQLSLFSGPLYFVIKILQTIKMTEELNTMYPNNRFVPVYWMATEDHDFHEIQSCNLFNREITWESNQEGPVGRFNLDGLEEVKSALKMLFANHEDSEVHKAIEMLKGEDYADVMRNFVNFLFGNRGLVIIDGDDPDLKEIFYPIVEREIVEQFSCALVNSTTDRLLDLGGKAQVHPRDINLFYIEKGMRSRLIPKDEEIVIEGKGTFSRKDVLETFDAQSFSPNVILRPLYQEMILPNLVYIGGAGEITYWLQLKGAFDACSIPYPLIEVRNSVIWIDKGTASKMNKYDFKVSDIFQDTETWKTAYVQEHAGDELDFSLLDERTEKLYETLKSILLSIDSTKQQMINAEIARITKQIEGIKAKAVKLSKGQHDQAMKTIDQIKSSFFPNNGLQERSVNFFRFCADGKVFDHIEELYETLLPFNEDLIVLLDD